MERSLLAIYYRFSEHVLGWRWVFMSLLGGLVTFYELSKHGLEALQKLNFELLFELFTLGVIMPLMGGYLLTKLAHARARSARYKERLIQYQTLFQELAQRRDLGEFLKFLVQYPGTILPVERTSLYVYDHRLAQLQLAADWNIQDVNSTLRLNSSSRICQTCLASYKRPTHPADQCPFAANPLSAQPSDEFCLSLSYKKVLIGTLRLTCPPGKTLIPEQIRFMNLIAPEIALALAIAIANPRQMAQVRMQTRLMERQQTAIDVHNALAQQISFLHLGLDRLASDDRMQISDPVRQELDYMRQTAAEAYQQVRHTLTLLLSWESVDVTQAIVDYSFKVAQRSHLAHGFTTTGEPIPLPATMRQQIFSLVQEGLNNVEKYAQAKHVQIHLTWSVDCLTLSIADDGVGFDPLSVPTEEHYGLIMIRELVKTMQGCFEIDSSPGRGTGLNFTFPLPCAQSHLEGIQIRPVESLLFTDPSV